jgi:hypothetical protein
MAEKIYKGKNLRIFVDDESILHSTECNFSTTRNFEGIATKDTNGNINTPGNYDWSLTANTLFADKDVANTTQTDFFEVLTKFKNATRVQVQFTTAEFGDAVISGFAYISSANVAAATEGSATGDFAFQGDGDFELERVAAVGPLPFMSSSNVIEIDPDTGVTFNVVASNSPTSYAFVATPNPVPAGITINAVTGVITAGTGFPTGVNFLGTSLRITNANGYNDFPVAFIIT